MLPDSKALIKIFEKHIAWQELPATFTRTRNGWAGYKDGIRITRYFFTEDGARDAVAEWEASDVKVQFQDP